MIDYNLEIGKEIKQYRKKAKMTQQQLADSIGKTESSIRKYEKGLVSIPLETLQKIATALGVDTLKLLVNAPFAKGAYKGATSEPQKISSKGQDLSSIIDVIQSLGFQYIDILENDKLIIALDKGEKLHQFFVPLDEINDIIADCESTLRDKLELLLIKKETAHNKNTINEKADIN